MARPFASLPPGLFHPPKIEDSTSVGSLLQKAAMLRHWQKIQNVVSCSTSFRRFAMLPLVRGSRNLHVAGTCDEGRPSFPTPHHNRSSSGSTFGNSHDQHLLLEARGNTMDIHIRMQHEAANRPRNIRQIKRFAVNEKHSSRERHIDGRCCPRPNVKIKGQ